MVFSRLAPFIQEYIYRHNWNELRPVQVAACEVIFDTDAHLLVAAGTAAGKTEAAFLPVLSELYTIQPQSIGAIYIGPIKALINDQFERLNELLKEADIPVFPWHGDVSQSYKNKAMKNPRGVLQITPESLESFLINKHSDLQRLFGDLRFVIIDEVHAFMGTERGCQILCQLARLAYLTNRQHRRIGLSATLGDYVLAETWLASDTCRQVITPKVDGGKRNLKLSVEHFFVSETEDLSSKNQGDYHEYIFNLTQGSKSLIFANNKSQTEAIIASLRQIAQHKGEPDIYHVHHGSIAASLRQAAEVAMQEKGKPAVTAATLTLEVGVDIGNLERVIQLEAPTSVASFLQRLGRTGRRGEAADMRFICAEDITVQDAPFPEQIPWQLLQSIAIIQLYLEERWVEPFKPLKYPLSLLYHQTMSVLVAAGEIAPKDLAKQVLSLSVFQYITFDDYRMLLQYLIEINHIQRTDTGNLFLGLAGEKIVNKYQFYAVFPEVREYQVKQDTQEIGSVAIIPKVGSQFGLAGRTWEVLEINTQKKVIQVKQVPGQASIYWRGGSGIIHSKILQRMRQVLCEETEYSYLQKNAIARLRTARQLFYSQNLDQRNFLHLEADKCLIFPWMGTIGYRTLERLIEVFFRETYRIKRITGRNPYYLQLRMPQENLEPLYQEILNLPHLQIIPEHLVSDSEAPQMEKYDEFIPFPLLRKAFIHDYLDLQQVWEGLGCIPLTNKP
ncbi:DEAD/DEAH box helicase [Calothrix sp. NIES-3974]|uniref:DEAD/DEAH box helicase n=1 Tax=Calothrix sp. NIES-3974 TaxID=2005462 RepID=UPI000B5F0F2D|nr:DEAD/DEAH box helicase [Calothrix sp. NIES-3974]BAZ07796.1 DEAD/DEAH box helicase-like protein [Calothrix sp. NIES-3974]